MDNYSNYLNEDNCTCIKCEEEDIDCESCFRCEAEPVEDEGVDYEG